MLKSNLSFFIEALDELPTKQLKSYLENERGIISKLWTRDTYLYYIIMNYIN